jgi:hypothetical protein
MTIRAYVFVESTLGNATEAGEALANNPGVKWWWSRGLPRAEREAREGSGHDATTLA